MINKNNRTQKSQEELIDKPNSVFLKEGVHHVLHDIAKGDLKKKFAPILAELKETGEDEKVSVLAWTLLKGMEIE